MFGVKFKVQEMLGVQACKGGCRMPMFGRDADLLIDIVFSFHRYLCSKPYKHVALFHLDD
jgi:hypothetical protein